MYVASYWCVSLYRGKVDARMATMFSLVIFTFHLAGFEPNGLLSVAAVYIFTCTPKLFCFVSSCMRGDVEDSRNYLPVLRNAIFMCMVTHYKNCVQGS